MKRFVYLTKPFARFARASGLGRGDLCKVANEVIAGRIDADLGGGVIKQRIARQGRGKSAGFRAIIAFRVGTRLFFISGFAKSDQANIDKGELNDLRRLADVILAYSETALRHAVAVGEFQEVNCDD